MVVRSHQRVALWHAACEPCSTVVRYHAKCYFNILTNLSVWVNQREVESRATEPSWCVAARGMGTYNRRVEMPRPTCIPTMQRREASASRELDGNILARPLKCE